jgi:transposase InsO family protein
MDRVSFYEWKRRYQTHGLEGLLDLPPVHKTHPQTTPEHVKEAVLELSARHPSWGCKRLEAELRREGVLISNFAIQGILVKVGRGTRFERFLALEEEALKGIEIPKEHLQTLEKLNPAFKERHVESSRPGELVSFDTFYVGTFKAIGKVYLVTAVDTFGSYAFGTLTTQRNAMAAAELLYAHVAPFYESHELALSAVLTDNGTEFCGTEEHPFEQLLFLMQIQHRRTRVKRPQTNGFVERFHRTILDEFFRIALRGTIFEDLEPLEIQLQNWLCYYNLQRAHLGYRNRGRTPYQTVELHLESVKQEA